MASEGPREPEGEGIKLSADVKPFVPKFAGLNVAWSESSEACVFPSCAATYYPFVQELPVTEQKIYAEDLAFGASTFPPQYLSSDITIHPYTYSPYALESTQNVCSVPGSQYDYNRPNCYPAFQMAKPRNERLSPFPQETKSLFKKKTYEEKKTCDEQKFDTKKIDGTISTDIKSAKGSHHISIHAESSLKSGKNKKFYGIVLASTAHHRKVAVTCAGSFCRPAPWDLLEKADLEEGSAEVITFLWCALFYRERNK